MTAPNLNAAWSRTLLDQLVRSGVRHAVVCPGSRSSPLAVGCAETNGLRTWSVIDERSAGFFALGLSKSTGTPVVLVATSGSAGAHFLPAAIEASLGSGALIVLTADRPWELQGFGAPQTIPQEELLGRFVLRFESLPAPEASAAAFSHLVAVTGRACDELRQARHGVVHFNVPFREPLAPIPDGVELPPPPRPAPTVHRPAPLPRAEVILSLSERLRRSPRGVIVCGPRNELDGFGPAIEALSRRTGYPVIAEATSQARYGHPSAIAHVDLLLQSPTVAAWRPELVVRFGGGVTGKRLQQWLDGSRAHLVSVSEDGRRVDPGHAASEVIEADAVAFATALTDALEGHTPDGAWSAQWAGAEARARAALEDAFAADAALTEPRIAREVVAACGEGTQLFVSSSMPIRDLDAFAATARGPLQVFCNRGANGIDGIVSTALGVAAGTSRRTVLLTGDLAFLHDVGGLLTAARADVPLTVVVVNNDGGGIFSFLPIAGATPHFEALFGTSHGLDLSHAAALYRASFQRPRTAAHLREAIAAGEGGGLHLIEVQVPRDANPAVHRTLAERVVRAVSEGGNR